MIRHATPEGLPEIVAIYNQAVAAKFATADLKPVSVNDRKNWFAQHTTTQHPIYVFEEGGEIKGWCSLSPYRTGRLALRFTAEISYYVREDSFRKKIASRLIQHAIDHSASLRIKTLVAIVLETNAKSRGLLEKFQFAQWGFLPRVADFDGQECGHVYYGRRLAG